MTGRHWSLRRVGFFVLTGVVLATSVFVAPLPYVRYLPGPPRELPPLIQLDDVETTPIVGETSLLTVYLDEVTPFQALGASRDPTEGLTPAGRIAPDGGLTPAFYEAQRESFARQFEVAVAVGAEAAGYEVEVETVPTVAAVLPGSAADGVLAQGDQLLAAEGDPIVDAQQLQDITLAADRGDELTLTILHPGGEERDVTVALDVVPQTGQVGLGVQVGTFITGVELPFEATLGETSVGGPSAGMMTALTTFDLLSEEDLVAGRTVFGTGTISPDGTVGTVGGVGAKVRAAAEGGADVILVPAGQLDEALTADPPPSLAVIPVATLRDAIEALRT